MKRSEGRGAGKALTKERNITNSRGERMKDRRVKVGKRDGRKRKKGKDGV